MKILNLEQLCENMIEHYKERIDALKRLGKKLEVSIIKVGDNEDSKRYIVNKIIMLSDLGFEPILNCYEESDPFDAVFDKIEYNNQKKIPTILQLSLPDSWAHVERDLINAIDKKLDADGFHTSSYDLSDCKTPYSATAKGVMQILKASEGDAYDSLHGKSVLVIGRSHLVGLPLASKLAIKGATVGITHTKTTNMKALLKHADIIISCAGQKELFKPEDVRDGVTLIGVGFNYDEQRKQHQDFNLEDFKDKDCTVTNRVGATGKLTILSLVDNILLCYERM